MKFSGWCYKYFHAHFFILFLFLVSVSDLQKLFSNQFCKINTKNFGGGYEINIGRFSDVLSDVFGQPAPEGRYSVTS